MTTINQLMRLNGRSALITGASGHLGRAMAETLAELGADLVLVDRPESDCSSLATSLQNKWKIGVSHYFCDLEQHDQRIDLLDKLLKEHAALNILINNAAFVGSSNLNGWAVPFEEQTVETWRRAMEVNLTAPFHLCQRLAPLLKRSLRATIINIGSIYAEYGPDWRLYEGTSLGNPAAYSASKGGLLQLTRWMSSTLAPEIRVNAISPGGIYRNQPESFVTQYKSRTPLGRMACEDDLRGAVAYLSTDLSMYMTGQVLIVDGGWGVW